MNKVTPIDKSNSLLTIYLLAFVFFTSSIGLAQGSLYVLIGLGTWADDPKSPASRPVKQGAVDALCAMLAQCSPASTLFWVRRYKETHTESEVGTAIRTIGCFAWPGWWSS